MAIKQYRKERGLTILEIAKILKVNSKTIVKIEASKIIRKEMKEKIGCPTGDFDIINSNIDKCFPFCLKKNPDFFSFAGYILPQHFTLPMCHGFNFQKIKDTKTFYNMYFTGGLLNNLVRWIKGLDIGIL
ncbi:MAG: hypothetical protein CVU12_08825 [Bacteroidetes bacterium HGW-Bacteroidetes-7]|jgi:hypothetical protein|nr:MAG: hypothetical protein CVU12_08825 [Bacteroidetes bacterium HGW-Bacteroidetes-7]